MMWNQFQTDAYEGMMAETIPMIGYQGHVTNAYFARPAGPGPFAGIVLIHHMPGWDEFYREFARRLAHHGYQTLCPDLYSRFGHGTPDDVTATVRGAGGVPDETVIGDCKAAADYLRALPNSNGKVGIIGTCSGGRHAFLTACSVPGWDAVVDCWGGGVVQADPDLTPQRPVSPITLTKNLQAPLLGLFGNEDQNPPPEQVNQLEEELKKEGKDYEFHRYDGAGHGIFYYDRPAMYRAEQAVDCWSHIFGFFGKYLQGR